MASSRDTFVPHKNLSTVVKTKMYFVGFKCTEKVNEISVCTDQLRTLLMLKEIFDHHCFKTDDALKHTYSGF